MYDRMVDNPELFVGSVSEGVQRALREPYAFFLERVMADYSASKNCELLVSIWQQMDGASRIPGLAFLR